MVLEEMESRGITFEGDHWIIFGDGHALRYFKKRRITKDGEERLEFIIEPNDEVMSEYGLTDNDLDQNTGTFINSYKESNVHVFFDSGNNSRILITVGVMNNPTPVSRSYQDLILRKESIDNEIEEKNRSISRINRMINFLNQRPMQLIRNDLIVMREMKQAIPRSSDEDEEEYYEKLREGQMDVGEG